MNETGISRALGQYLEGAALGYPIIYANDKAGLPAAPYLVVQFVPTSAKDATLDGSGPINMGFVQVTVVSDLGGFDTAALTIAQAVKARFAYPTHLNATGLEVTVTAPPFIGTGFSDGVHWRIPVRITYTAIKQ